MASHLLDDLPNTSAEDDDEAEEVLRTPVVFIDTAGSEYYERVEGDHKEGSRCNENEAMVVKKYITRLVCLDPPIYSYHQMLRNRSTLASFLLK